MADPSSALQTLAETYGLTYEVEEPLSEMEDRQMWRWNATDVIMDDLDDFLREAVNDTEITHEQATWVAFPNETDDPRKLWFWTGV